MRNNKRNVVLVAAAAAMLFVPTACDKAKTCRCSVLGTNKVRIIKIDDGQCEALRVYRYHDIVDSAKVDSLLCTDYEFAIDSIFNE
ncbi:MAG: hypothetical protein IJ760_06600 [Bacteroidales bacterium]|nr:hypothetical protein [Bacteroidales bacterium]